ncbi:MAG: nucleoside monophosphate kinase [Puniceicoccales bacterium]|jgi:adenylate kinase|nr:nucleoside monophosphate kinase [Puniceicoccales bacterium]
MSPKNSSEALDLFLKELGERKQFVERVPRKIIWLSGAPGAGKGTNESYIIDHFKLYEKPLIASSLLNSQEMREKINRGLLLDDITVVSSVFDGLTNPIYSPGVLVDGFPRTLGQAKSVVWLRDHFKEKHIATYFSVVVLMLDEVESVHRQLHRGLRALQHNERVRQSGKGVLKEVRSTDLDPAIAKQRYALFMKETYAALQFLKKSLPFVEISCGGSLETVKGRVLSSISAIETYR